ncbi:oligosaccharide flippase family protein [Alkalihalobacillus pseudalcaliphilus]|uniref:oligosaccharide flippase family protein n=1 Tax=Alkalihalobacillus pseudalcaliphilus TaxID=79884 RepID=UPI002362DAC5|nr:oligosaccharide flippase family protein [Alkalihalobacillus pseudalcaliphilus]
MASQLKYGVYLSYVTILVSNLTNLILTPFIARNLGQSEYGLYMLIGALVGYIAVLDFGLGNATVRFVSKYRAEENKKGEENFLASTLIIYIAISVLVGLIGTVIYFNIDYIFSSSLSANELELAKIMFLILVITLAFTLPMKLFTGIINAYERFAFPKSLVIIRLIIRAIIILLLLSLGFNAIAIVLVDAILNLIMMFISIVYVFVKLKVRFKLHQFNMKLIKEITSYSSLIFVSVIVDQIYWRIGHLVLGIYASTTDVAIFAIGMIFGQLFINFSTAISGVFLPKVTKMIVKNASSHELTRLLIRTGRLQFIVLGLALGGFLLFGQSFIQLWLGNGYELSWYIALLVMIPLSVVLTQTIGITILQAKNMHGFRAITYLIISLINLCISIYLVQIYGVIGATLGTTLSLIVGNLIVMNIYYNYKVGLDMIAFFKGLTHKLLISLITSILIGYFLLDNSQITWLGFSINALIFCIIYGVIMYIYGMNKSEKDLINKEIKRVFKK